MTTKVCNTCLKQKNLSDFSMRSQVKKTFHNKCKICTNSDAKLYREKNVLLIREKQKKWYISSGQKWKKEYDKSHSENRKIYEKNRYHTDRDYRFRKVLRTRLNKTFKGIKFSQSIIDYIGIPLKSFYDWIEFQFDNNMNWNNYGQYWDIDHVIPCRRFNLSNEKHIKICFNWKNLQPLEKRKNYSKSDKLDIEQCLNQIKKIRAFKTLYSSTKLLRKLNSGPEKRTGVR